MNTVLLFLVSISCFFLMVQSEFNFASSLNLPTGISNGYQTHLDEDAGFVYFIDAKENGDTFLFKYDIDTLDYLDYSKIEIEGCVIGAIDTVNKVIYVMTYFGSQLSKIDLNTMQIVANLTLSAPFYNSPQRMEIDVVNQKVYVGYNNPSSVYKVDLASFTEEAFLSLSNDKVTGSVIDVDNGILYAATDSNYGNNATIYKIDLSTFTQVDSLLVGFSGVAYLKCGVIDNTNQMMYFGTNQNPMNIVKINLADFTPIEVSATAQSDCRSAGIDETNGFAYFLTGRNISKLDLTIFAITDYLYFEHDYFYSMALDSSAQNAYMVSSSSNVYQLNLPALTEGNKSDSILYTSVEFMLIDETNQIGYIYFDNYGGIIVKIDLQSFSLVDHFIIGLSLYIYDGEIDNINGFMYLFLDNNSNFVIMKINLADFSINETVQIASGIEAYEFAFDSQTQILYVEYYNDTYGIDYLMKISCPDLQIIDSVDFGQMGVYGVYFDISRGYSYIWYEDFSAIGSEYFVYKVQLSNLGIIAQVDLTDYDIDECLLDKTDQLLYILYHDVDYYYFLRSIDLVNMQVMNNPLNTTYEDYYTFLIEPNDALLFLVMEYYNETSYEYEGKLLQIEASSNQLISDTLIDYDLFVYYEYGSDPSKNYGYLLDYHTTPITFYQISFTTPPPSSSQQILFSFLIFGIMMILGLF
ncbi:protein nirf [Anaeramoeba ignava]|uniref:Protein nirf n=1 Tax=Anaeramoeba ignava TaxID=1746090 RepID=A0A9Q0LHC0_ANAIG|nr:protein nirf [Anaeramoeba ignava]